MEGTPPTISVQRTGDVTVVGLVGEHDMLTVGDVRRTLESQGDGRGLVVSLAGVEFFDSSIVHALFAADTRQRERGRALVLHVGTPSIVGRVLEISGLSEKVRCTKSLAEAIRLAGAQPERVE